MAACGGDDQHRGGLPDASTAQLIVDPPDVAVTIINDVAVVQPYTAHIFDASGVQIDVTAETAFTLSDPDFGTFDGANLSVTGHGAGMVRVQGTARGRMGDAGLAVTVQKIVVDPAIPDAPTLFQNATEDPTLAPKIVYPSDKILVPPNLGQFDVHWQNNTAAGASLDLFEIKMANQFVDIRLYTTGLDKDRPAPFWTVYAPDVWLPIASTRQQVALTVAGLRKAAPASKGTAVSQQVDVTNEKSQGGIYYWTTSSPQGIWRYDVGKPDVPPAPFFAGDQPTPCIGCHVLSRDGSKMAMTIDSATGRGTVYNVSDRSVLLPFDGANNKPQLHFDFAAFDSGATKLITIEGGVMNLRQLDGTLITGPVAPSTANVQTTMPELSPDDTKLVDVEYPGGEDFETSSGSIMIRSFDPVANTFGAPTALVPYVAPDGNNPAIANWYPSFSPDGEWVVFTRTNGQNYDQASAETWMVKADGLSPPVKLDLANLAGTDNLTNSWARWVPFAQTFGADNQKLFYLTFSSKRPFGVRLPNGGQPQIWMTPVFPDRAAVGQDPSGNAFRVPFQDVTTSNHIAQWTKAVVVQ
ncbi:MAG TPA: hypothetical protein VGC42_17620 [Kofleriaceae bacterium]